MSDPFVKSFRVQMDRVTRAAGGSSRTARYQQPGRSFTLFVTPSDGQTTHEPLLAAANGLSSDGRLTVITSAGESGLESSGVAWECAPVTAAAEGSLCVWDDFIHTIGVMLGTRIDVSQAKVITLEAHDAVKR